MLDSALRRRGLLVLLADTFLMFAGFFMLVPLISIHYVHDLGLTAAAVGLVLAVRQLTQQSLTLLGGALSDRWGVKSLIGWGLAVRAVSFAGLAWAESFWLLLACCLLAALGGALFDAPRSAAIAVLTVPEERSRFYSLSGIVGGLGMTIGPLVGALLLRVDFWLVCYASGLCFGVAALVTALWLPRVRVAAPPQSLGAGLRLVAHDRPFVALTILLAGFWFMWVQLSISLSLVSQQWPAPILTTPLGTLRINGAAWIYALNAALTVALQYPLLWACERWLRPLPILTLGSGLMAAGLGLVGVAGGFGALLGCVVLFSLGAMLVQPMQQTVTAAMAEPQLMGAYFGFNALALAFGGGLGNYLGGWLYDRALRWQLPMLPWLVFGAVGLTVVVGLVLLEWAQRRQSARATPHPAS